MDGRTRGVASRVRMFEHGSLKMYNCFVDETLNIPVRNIAKFAHRLTFYRRIHTFVDLQAKLGLLPYVPDGQWLPLVAGY